MSFHETSEGIRLHIRVTPKAHKDVIAGVGEDDQRHSFFKVRVRALPDKGKANQAVTKLLAKSLNVPQSAIALSHGSTARLKTFMITLSPDERPALIQQLQSLM